MGAEVSAVTLLFQVAPGRTGPSGSSTSARVAKTGTVVVLAGSPDLRLPATI
jgi:hypothetical protein